jgi:hypothetical protein
MDDETKLTKEQKLKLKVAEALNDEKDLPPPAAERVNQIVNDAIASMPPSQKILVEEKSGAALARKLKAQLEAAVAGGAIPKELAEKIESIVASVEAEGDAPKTTEAPAQWPDTPPAS